MTTRSWAWLATRIRGLLNHPIQVTRIKAALTMRPDDRGGSDDPRPR